MSDDLYSLVQRRLWTDARFRKLSKPDANARDLFLYLLTTPRATPIPGLIVAGEPALAEELDWPLKGLQRCMSELEGTGMVRLDRAARLLWLPNGLRHNAPRSPKNVLGWAKHWRLLPECDLLTEAAAAFEALMVARGPAFSEAFDRVLGRAPPSRPRDDANQDRTNQGTMTGSMTGSYMPSQEQDQDQDQEQETQTHTSRARVPARTQGVSDGRMPVAAFTADDFGAMLAEVPALADLVADPALAGDLCAGFQMACGDAATLDLARAAVGSCAAAEDLRSMPLHQQRERLGRYLGNARRYNRPSDRGSAPESVTEEQRVVLAVFGEEWAKRKQREFVQATGDGKHAASLVEAAKEHASRLKIRPRDIFRHWAAGYVRDADKFVADQDHPLRLLPSRLTSYGLPEAPRAKKPKPDAAAAPVYVPPPANLLASIGRGIES